MTLDQVLVISIWIVYIHVYCINSNLISIAVIRFRELIKMHTLMQSLMVPEVIFCQWLYIRCKLLLYYFNFTVLRVWFNRKVSRKHSSYGQQSLLTIPDINQKGYQWPPLYPLWNGDGYIPYSWYLEEVCKVHELSLMSVSFSFGVESHNDCNY